MVMVMVMMIMIMMVNSDEYGKVLGKNMGVVAVGIHADPMNVKQFSKPHIQLSDAYTIQQDSEKWMRGNIVENH